MGDTMVVACRWKEPLEPFLEHVGDLSYLLYDVGEQQVMCSGTSGEWEIPDVGRESAVYLRYINTYYDTLTPWTIFTQANPAPHKVPPFHELETPAEPGFIPLAKEILTSGPHGEPHHNNPTSEAIPVGELWARYRSDPFPGGEGIRFRSAGIFMVHRDRILKNPVATYEDMLEQVSREKDPPEGYAFERLWGEIFDESSVWEVQNES